MSEAGGPVYEGVGRPEVAKKGVVEKVRDSLERKYEEINKEFETRGKFGQEKQQRVIERYQTMVGGMNESILKSAVKLYEPIVRADAFVKGINAAVLDTSVNTLLKYGRHALSLASLVSGVVAFDAFKNKKSIGTKIGGVVGAVGLGAGAVGVDMARKNFTEVRPVESLMRKHEDAKDFIGLKGVDILNKIIGRKAPVAVVG